MTVRLRRAYGERLCHSLVDRLLAGASLDEPDPQDVRQVIDREYEPLRERFSHGRDDLDAMSPEQWKESFYRPELKDYYERIYPDIAPLFDTTSKESYYENRTSPARRTIRKCMVLRAILGDRTDAHDPTQSKNAEAELVQSMTDRLCDFIYGKG